MMLRGTLTGLATLLLPSVAFGPQLPEEAARYRLVLPQLVRQGETFTGLVLEETEAGEKPVDERARISVAGKVVPVGPKGVVEFPAFVRESGNAFVVVQVLRAGAARAVPANTASQHVEIMRVVAGVPPKVASASTLLTEGGRVRVIGQGLSALKEAALVRPDGTTIPLTESVGSSLERLYLTSTAPVPAGTYRFTAHDGGGKTYQAPNPTHSLRIHLEGPPILHRGQRGNITVAAEADIALTIELLGGQPQIELNERLVKLRRGGTHKVRFVARALGQYHLRARVVDSEDPANAPGGSPVGARADPVEARYDAQRKSTVAVARFHIVDVRGQPVRSAPLDVALVHAGGVEYARVGTDKQGLATFSTSLPGQVATGVLAAHVYRVLGRAWKEGPPPGTIPERTDTPTTGIPQLTTCACELRSRWEAAASIKIAQKLAYHSQYPLAKLPYGSAVGLSVLANDVDVLVQECEESGIVCSRRVKDLADDIRYEWKIVKGAEFVEQEGADVNSTLLKLTKLLNKGQKAAIELELSIADSGDKGKDAPIRSGFTLTLARIDEGYDPPPGLRQLPGFKLLESFYYTAALKWPVLQEFPGTPLPPETGGPCVPERPVPTPAPDLAAAIVGGASFEAPGANKSLCPTALTLVTLDASDTDTLTLTCRPSCGNPVRRDLAIADPVIGSWRSPSGGSFPAPSGTGAIFVAPARPGPGIIEAALQESGTLAQDAPDERLRASFNVQFQRNFPRGQTRGVDPYSRSFRLDSDAEQDRLKRAVLDRILTLFHRYDDYCFSQVIRFGDLNKVMQRLRFEELDIEFDKQLLDDVDAAAAYVDARPYSNWLLEKFGARVPFTPWIKYFNDMVFGDDIYKTDAVTIWHELLHAMFDKSAPRHVSGEVGEHVYTGYMEGMIYALDALRIFEDQLRQGGTADPYRLRRQWNIFVGTAYNARCAQTKAVTPPMITELQALTGFDVDPNKILRRYRDGSCYFCGGGVSIEYILPRDVPWSTPLICGP